ncbi:hypothetical protein HK103_002362 [Boothiomyces macroporosus]|uniref:Uncharacterized protein n=1 Tax=Boothiomyces macroporosus TaxID=261099 RepID=A0AAD5U9E1_9FUNG|nr:hypothetical protein HK103_002362 [Boothiomyces macroporosus]
MPNSNLQQISLVSIRTREVCDAFVKNIGKSFLKNVGLEVCAEFLDEVLEAVINSKVESLSFPYACSDCWFGFGDHKCTMFIDSNLTILQRYINKLPVKELSIERGSLKIVNLISVVEYLNETASIRELDLSYIDFDNCELVQLGNHLCWTRLTSISFSVKTLDKDSVAKQFAMSVCNSNLRILTMYIEDCTLSALETLLNSLQASQIFKLNIRLPSVNEKETRKLLWKSYRFQVELV